MFSRSYSDINTPSLGPSGLAPGEQDEVVRAVVNEEKVAGEGGPARNRRFPPSNKYCFT